jgi:hypothetical protein
MPQRNRATENDMTTLRSAHPALSPRSAEKGRQAYLQARSVQAHGRSQRSLPRKLLGRLLIVVMVLGCYAALLAPIGPEAGQGAINLAMARQTASRAFHEAGERWFQAFIVRLWTRHANAAAREHEAVMPSES